MISFFLTTRCNLKCVYCYNLEERLALKEHTLSFDIAKAAIDWYFATNSNRHVRFYGPGEPTQAFDLMRQIVGYAEYKSRGVTVEIQTNGVFGAEVREWMLDHVNIIWMSFDGPPDIQNHNRPTAGGGPSAPVVEGNARWLIQHRDDRALMVGARVTITDSNADRQIEMIDYFRALGIRHAWTNPLFFSVGEKPVCQDPQKWGAYRFDMDKYLDCYVDARQYAATKGVFWGSFLAVNFDGESSRNCRACLPAPHVTPDGYLSACDMVMLGSEARHMAPLVYARWNPAARAFELDDARVEALRRRSSESLAFAHCQDCEAKLHCGGYCLGEVVNETGALNGIPRNCAAVRWLLRRIGTSTPYPYLHP